MININLEYHLRHRDHSIINMNMNIIFMNYRNDNEYDNHYAYHINTKHY